MKLRKLFISLYVVACGLVTLSSCSWNQMYKVTVEDYFHLLYENPQTSYRAGSHVVVKLGFKSGPRVGILVNGEEIPSSYVDADLRYEAFEFTMPSQKVLLQTTFNDQVSEKDQSLVKLVCQYDYGVHIENKITGLWEYGFLGPSIQLLEAPRFLPIIPGDILYLCFTGELMSQSMYPANWLLKDGEVVFNTYDYTRTIKLEENIIHRTEEGYIEAIDVYPCNETYVILDEDFHYVRLEEYNGEELYGALDKSKDRACADYDECQAPSITALFAYNPRPNV